MTTYLYLSYLSFFEIQLGVKYFYIFFDGAGLWWLVLSTYQNTYKEKIHLSVYFAANKKLLLKQE